MIISMLWTGNEISSLPLSLPLIVMTTPTALVVMVGGAQLSLECQSVMVEAA